MSNVVTVEEFGALTKRVDDLGAQLDALVEALELIVETIEQDIVDEIDDVLGDQPDVSPAMIDALRAMRARSSN